MLMMMIGASKWHAAIPADLPQTEQENESIAVSEDSWEPPSEDAKEEMQNEEWVKDEAWAAEALAADDWDEEIPPMSGPPEELLPLPRALTKAEPIRAPANAVAALRAAMATHKGKPKGNFKGRGKW